MADETYLATTRAAADTPSDEEITKEELQRRMEQARETITQTVTEIKDTVTNQYQSVKETISETLDWREQFRKRPVAWSVGALSAGFVVGYSLGGALKGDGGRDDYPSYEETDVWNVGAPLAAGAAAGARGGKRAAAAPARSYASQAITGGAYGSTEYDEENEGAQYSSLSTGGDVGARAEAPAEATESGPSLIDRFKETKAFDRLQGEVSKLGDRFIDQLSTVGQDVVLPALFGKIKELFGVDLSGQQKQGQLGGGAAPPATAGTPSSTPASASRGSSQAAAAGGGSSYGTSENRSYSSEGAPRDDYGRSGAGSSSTAGSDLNRERP